MGGLGRGRGCGGGVWRWGCREEEADEEEFHVREGGGGDGEEGGVGGTEGDGGGGERDPGVAVGGEVLASGEVDGSAWVVAVVGDAVEVEGCRVPACNDQVEGPCIRIFYEENSFWVRGQGEGGYRVAYLAAVSVRGFTELVDVY